MKAQAVWPFFLIALLSLNRCEDTLHPQFFSQFGFQKEQTITGRLDADIILPCLYEIGSEPVIYWRKQDSETIHSFFKDTDQIVGTQYINRTSLFHDEIKKGNASLLLKRLRLQDEDSYTCYVGTSVQNSWVKVMLKLEGFMTPVIEYEETNTSSNLRCSVLCAQPCPNITWQVDNVSISNHIVEEMGFYVSRINIESSDSFYECTIENTFLEQKWTGRWTKKDLKATESKDISLLCELGNNLFQPDEDFVVTWSRKQNGNFSILASFQSSSQTANIIESRLSLNGELIIQGNIFSSLTNISILDSGEYLCNISSSKYTLLTTQILNVEPHTIPIVIISIAAAVGLVLAFLVLLCIVPALRRCICCCLDRTTSNAKRNERSETNTNPEEISMIGERIL